MLIDTHCHLDFPDLAADLEPVLHRAKQAGVTRMITISTHVARVDRYRALAESHDNVFFSVGTHPHYAHEELDVSAEHLVHLSHHPKCVAIGEAGLDYHYDRAPREAQVQGLRTHIAASRMTGLPLVIHARAADEDMISILEEEAGKGAFPAVLHCFSSGPELARRALALGHYLSMSGILTFKASEELRDIAKAAPLDRLLVETDSPYLAPMPHRGKRNEPAFCRHTAEVLAGLKGLSLQDLAETTSANAERLFTRLPPLCRQKEDRQS
jgi:TatD DNase family protein